MYRWNIFPCILLHSVLWISGKSYWFQIVTKHPYVLLNLKQTGKNVSVNESAFDISGYIRIITIDNIPLHYIQTLILVKERQSSWISSNKCQKWCLNSIVVIMGQFRVISLVKHKMFILTMLIRYISSKMCNSLLGDIVHETLIYI